jgi:hypothetical protein
MRTILLNLEELSINPFREHICRIFSSSGNGDLTFEDFLDMMSVFSEGVRNVRYPSVSLQYNFNESCIFPIQHSFSTVAERTVFENTDILLGSKVTESSVGFLSLRLQWRWPD